MAARRSRWIRLRCRYHGDFNPVCSPPGPGWWFTMLHVKSLVRSFSHRGFTLIELLIVIAIILILIAIALPNFLEALLRATLTRVKADMRTVAIALEAYQTEWGRYPPTAFWEPTRFDPSLCSELHSDYPCAPMRYSMLHLTTPIRYLEKIPQDAFAPPLGTPSVPAGDHGEKRISLHPIDSKYGHGFVYWSLYRCALISGHTC